MKDVQESPAAELADKGGVPAAEIGKYPGSIEFTLPDTGKTVVMRKPMLADSFAASADKTVDLTNPTTMTAALLAQICTFDGKPINFHDWGKTLPLVDYNLIVSKYNDEITEPGK